MRICKLFSHTIGVFGMVMMFAVSGWSASNSPIVNVACSPSSLNEGNSGTTNVVCTVSINVAPDQKPLSLLISTANVTAVAGSDYTALSQPLTFAVGTGTLTQSFTIPVMGDTTYEPNETFTATISNNGTNSAQSFTFGTSVNTITIINDDPLPALSAANVSQAEGSSGGYTNMVFTATLSNPSSATATVNFATASGSATSSSFDFADQAGILTFAPGETVKTISVPIFGDTNIEGNETFTVRFTSPSGMSVSTASSTGTILNDDFDVPLISIADQSMAEGSSGGYTNMVFTVTVSNMQTNPVTVSYATSDGTALSSSDYTATSGTLTFSPGTSPQTQTISVPVFGDTVAELNENFYVILSNPTGSASITDGNATGNIIDDDSSGSCSPYVGQLTINEYNFIPSVKDEFGNLIAGYGNFVELKVIGQTLRDAMIADSHFVDGWRLEIYNSANNPNVANAFKLLPDRDPACDFALTGYLIYTFPSSAMTEGAATIVVKDDQNRIVDILYYGNSSVMYTPSTCQFVYDTNMTLVQTQNKDVFRIPDGTGDWTDFGSGANSGASRCTNPGGGFEGIHTIFDAIDYKSSVTSADIGRPITTKIVDKTINLTAISTNSSHTALADSIKVSSWLARKSGNEYFMVQPLQEIDFDHVSSVAMNPFIRASAGKDHVIAFKYCDDNGTYRDWDTCWPQGITAQQKVGISWDNFAVRPDRFFFNASHYDMPNLLRAGQDYNMTMHGYVYGANTDTPEYNVTSANSVLTMTTTKYDRNNMSVPSMAGTASFGSSGFDMGDGVSVKTGTPGNEVAGVVFDDVGKIDIHIEDQIWAAVDINNINDTTPHDCSADGAYVCGDTNLTFIPYRFDFNELNITNNNGNPGTFTYLANEVTQMAGRIQTQMRALNKAGGVTQNFAVFPLWENSVTVVPVVTKLAYLYPDANETNITNLAVGFGTGGDANGTKTVLWNETNTSKYLRFNFRRDVNQVADPFDVNGTDLNISIVSHYVDPADGGLADINGSRNGDANGSARFVYGRLIPRDVRVFGNTTSFSSSAWYEAYNASSIGGVALAPSRNDAAWFINSLHNDVNDGDANVTRLQTNTGSAAVNINSNALNGVETYTFSPFALGNYKAHILTAPWLWYGINAAAYADPSAANLNCSTHPCFNISVIPPQGVTGSAKTQLESGKKANKATQGGGPIYDYAPAIK